MNGVSAGSCGRWCGVRVAVAAVLLVGCATTRPIDVPANLAPSPGEALVASLDANGVQIYECRASTAASSGYEWAFVAPEATLADQRGRAMGTHGAGPHWQAPDGSRVDGVVKARADAPAPGAIPWLLLSTKSVGPTGAFSKVTSVQRVATVGGAAPASGCDAGHIGAKARVPYTAVYRMFAAG